ncbi:MAG: hypothetical protein IJB69_07255 [Clostridia bacterium]|nr:hypothetical protein [Clostridia bacterium]
MKQHRKLLLILAIVLSVAVAAGSTMAYLQDTDEDVNVMTLGNVYIEQLEYEREDVEAKGSAAVVKEFQDDKPLYPAVYPDISAWQPGVTQEDAIITWDQLGNEGSWNGIWDPDVMNNEVDKFVFVKNTGNSPAYVRTWFAFELGNLTLQEWWDLTHLNLNTNHWDGLDDLAEYSEETIGGVRYAVAYATYTRNDGILQPGELSRPSLLQVALDKAADNKTVEGFGDSYEILVVSQAVQTAGFDDAETALNAAFTAKHPFAEDMVEKEVAEKEFNATHPVEYNGTRYATLQEGVNMAAANGGGVVKVYASLREADTVMIPDNLEVTIEGVGSTVYRADGFTGNLIDVGSNATLTLKNIALDGGAVWTGEVDATLKRGTTNTGTVATGGLIVATGTNSKIVLNTGTVLQNNDGASAVNPGTRRGNTLTLNQAKIVNNSSGAGAIWGGGHITVNEGSQISYNSSTGLAGAIRMVSSCNLTMNGGEISNNKAAGDGGAIWGYGSSTYNLNGGEMANNESAGTGGAIYTGTYSAIMISDDFELYGNKAANTGAIRFTDHSSLTMNGGKIYGNTQSGESNAFNTWNNSMAITGGSIEDNFSFVGGLGLTIGEADIAGVIYFDLSTNHNTAYLAENFNGFSFRVNEEDEHFSNFNFKPATGYTYVSGDEAKLICLNDGYTVYWDTATNTFRLKAQ